MSRGFVAVRPFNVAVNANRLRQYRCSDTCRDCVTDFCEHAFFFVVPISVAREAGLRDRPGGPRGTLNKHEGHFI